MKKPQLAIVYLEGMEQNYFDDFVSEISKPNLDFEITTRPALGPMAAVEWLVPTVVTAFIGKAYFSEFFKELGKDHYLILKESLKKLTTKTIKQKRLEPVLIGTTGKIKTNNPYTMTLSIIAEGNNGHTFKLLLPKFSQQFDYEGTTEKFLELIADYHLSGTASKIAEETKKSNIPRGTILFHLNPETQEIEWLDHTPKNLKSDKPHP